MSSAFKYKGCGPQKLGSAIKLAPILGMIAKKVIVDKVAEKVSGGTPLKKKVLDHTNTTCWPGHAPKAGEPKTKISSKTGRRVNNCS
jgi:hypothetical protein